MQKIEHLTKPRKTRSENFRIRETQWEWKWERELVSHGEDLRCSSSETFGILRILQWSLLECRRQSHFSSQASRHPYLRPLLHFWYSHTHLSLSLTHINFPFSFSLSLWDLLCMFVCFTWFWFWFYFIQIMYLTKVPQTLGFTSFLRRISFTQQLMDLTVSSFFFFSITFFEFSSILVLICKWMD